MNLIKLEGEKCAELAHPETLNDLFRKLFVISEEVNSSDSRVQTHALEAPIKLKNELIVTFLSYLVAYIGSSPVILRRDLAISEDKKRCRISIRFGLPRLQETERLLKQNDWIYNYKTMTYEKPGKLISLEDIERMPLNELRKTLLC